MVEKETYEKARLIFLDFKKEAESARNKEKIKEFKLAANELIKEYNTANRENRFIVGGAIEILFSVLLKSLNFRVKWLSGEMRYDLMIDNIGFSLKTNFTGNGDIRLINILGNKEAKWEEPTIFLISGIGMCYSDPEIGNFQTKHTNDALTINVKQIINFVKNHPQFLIKIILKKKQRDIQNSTKTASMDVAKVILEKIQSRHLIKYIKDIIKNR
ncbi:MAG: hypothetical protein KatS3mg096_408 [Candidatus Parcubacteria bacterium]|nr:MAG: hypothetical protein KatS3mg096_408 [Candidatus Parcubacteria bacterium]